MRGRRLLVIGRNDSGRRQLGHTAPVTMTEPTPVARSRWDRTRFLPFGAPVVAAGTVLVVAVLVVVALVWSAPRDDVAVPGPDATPEQVVMAYVKAVNARDLDTANVIDARPDSDLERLSGPIGIENVRMARTVMTGSSAHVHFIADFRGGDGSLDGHQWWGYVLEQKSDGLWRIVDAGVS
jgi:hypothetical protein